MVLFRRYWNYWFWWFYVIYVYQNSKKDKIKTNFGNESLLGKANTTKFLQDLKPRTYEDLARPLTSKTVASELQKTNSQYNIKSFFKIQNFLLIKDTFES